MKIQKNITEKTTASPHPAEHSSSLFLEKVKITDGRFEYQDVEKKNIFLADGIEIFGNLRLHGKNPSSTARVEVEEMNVTPGFKLHHIKTPASYSNQWLYLNQLEADSYGGKIRSQFSGKLVSDKRPFQLQFQAEHLDLPEMIRNMEGDPKGFEGKLNLYFKGNGDLHLIKQARGEGSFSIEPVQFEGISFIKKLGELVGLPGLSDIKFDSLQSDFRMEEESLYFKNLETLPANSATRITGHGRLLFNGEINFDGNLLINSKMIGTLTQILQKLLLKHSEGVLNIPFQVTGTTQNPKVEVPMLRTTESIIRDVLDFVPFIDLNKLTKPR